MFVGGAVGGAFWGFLPAYAKVRWNTSETLFALMLNYIATYIVQLLRRGPWEDVYKRQPLEKQLQLPSQACLRQQHFVTIRT